VNQKTPSIINILINTVFGAGVVPGDYLTLHPKYNAKGGLEFSYLYSQATGVDEDGVMHNVYASKDNYLPSVSAQESMYGTALKLLIVVVISVPLMLLVKPLHFKFTHKSGPQVGNEIEFQRIQNGDAEQSSVNKDRGGTDELAAKQMNSIKSIEEALNSFRAKDEAHNFGEIFIHQMIETIEFVLGSVSNTASYLRLWALSLAHSQLAEVFLSLIFNNSLKADSLTTSIITGIIFWPPFWGVSFFVLMCMDCLECTLHTLRLHWVEFQNKFYKGEGYAFKPYNFKIILLNVLQSQ